MTAGGESVSAQSEAPDQAYGRLRRFMPKRVQPVVRGLRKRWEMRQLTLEEPYRSIYPFTQTSPARQESLVQLAKTIEERGLDGAIVECGVLDGGSAALIGSQTRASGRPIHLFDAWQGLPGGTPEDGAAAHKWEGEVVGSPRRVVAAMKAAAVDLQRVYFHRGWFEETFPDAAEPARVALLHIDCDFYEPTRLCLEAWVPRIVPGGFAQFDDYGAFAGARRAIDELLRRRPELSLETYGSPRLGEAYYLQVPSQPRQPGVE